MQPYMPALKHAGLALGAGLSVFIIGVETSVNLSPYWQSACDGALAVLAGLGIGYAKRQAP